MGQTINLSQTNELLFVPRYRITFRFSAFPTTRHFTVDGNERLHKFGTVKEQVTQAIAQARVLVALEYGGANVGEEVLKVEREWESEKGWDEMTTSFRATPGTKITVWTASSNQDGHGVRPCFYNIVVGRWHSMGDGTAALLDERGRHMGIYERDDIFSTW